MTWKAIQVLELMRFWVGDSRLGAGAAASASRGDITGEIKSLNLQGENPRSGLNWLCMAIALLEALFYERGLSTW
jgi:hypothetical protein